MSLAVVRRRVKPWLLPVSMVGGVLFHEAIAKVAFVTPYLIFAMLIVTYSKVKPREFKVSRLSWLLLVSQMGGAAMAYFVLAPFDEVVAQGVMMCFFCPTATAAPVVTGMLGGEVSRVASFSILSNVAVAILAPVVFARVSTADVSHSIATSQLLILQRVVPLLLAPLFIAFIMRRFLPKINGIVARSQGVSFYLWAVALFIVVGRAVSFVISEPSGEIPSMVAIAVGAAVACCLQFWAGRKIGCLCGDKIAGAQGLGQKNTILAIWLALTWLHPLASVGPAAYIAWQNIINSAQLYRASRRVSAVFQNKH